jgi:hypothetical protein
MSDFELRGKQIYIESAPAYESSQWNAKQTDPIFTDTVVVRAIILATRTPEATEPEAYAYLEENMDLARGIWLNEASYTEIKPVTDTLENT